MERAPNNPNNKVNSMAIQDNRKRVGGKCERLQRPMATAVNPPPPVSPHIAGQTNRVWWATGGKAPTKESLSLRRADCLLDKRLAPGPKHFSKIWVAREHRIAPRGRHSILSKPGEGKRVWARARHLTRRNSCKI